MPDGGSHGELVPEGDPVLVAVDDTLFRRASKKVHAIGWFHDGSVKGRRVTAKAEV